MATSSTVVTVKNTLVTLLRARPGLLGVQVEYARLVFDQLEAEAIFLEKVRGRHEIAVMKAGRKARDEEYTLDIVVSVLDKDGTPKDAETRAFALLAEVEGALADDPQLGIPTVLMWATAGEWEATGPGRVADGALSEIKLGVDCRARLT